MIATRDGNPTHSTALGGQVGAAPGKARLTSRRGCFLDWIVCATVPLVLLAAAGAEEPVAGAPADVVASAPQTAAPMQTVTREQARLLLREFQRSQSSESKALRHRQSFEVKELAASLKARMKEWEGREREARRQFFVQTTEGPKRREYMKDFLERRKAMQAMLNEEKVRRQQEHDVRRKAVQEDQAQKTREFKEVLGHGERPAERLWPKPGQ